MRALLLLHCGIHGCRRIGHELIITHITPGTQLMYCRIKTAMNEDWDASSPSYAQIVTHFA